jgi:hypothetical protein
MQGRDDLVSGTAPPRSSAEWFETIAELGAQRFETIAELGAQLVTAEVDAEAIRAGRGAIALRAQLGDAEARATLEAQDQALAELEQRKRNLEGALEAAGAERRAAQAREAAARRAEAEREADALTLEALAVAERADAAIVQLAADAQKIERLLARAASVRGANSTLVGERVERAIRGAFWWRGLKIGDYAQRQVRRPLVEGLGAAINTARAAGAVAAD